MNKWLSIAILLTAAGCSSRSNIAMLQSESLVAGKIPSSSQMGLTKEDKNRLNRHYPKTLERIEGRQKLSVQDIKNMTRIGASDAIIIFEIQATRTLFFLTPDDERELEQAGVSNQVINAMKDTIQDRY
ncbi:MAG: hypothetical protein K1000chlam2_00708 [Chlamydiae bacterium]|nr:hypothetical protein [Chlamydiota bacterium]